MDDGIGGEIFHRVFGEVFVVGVAGVMEEEIGGAGYENVFVALGMWRVGVVGRSFCRKEAGGVGVAEVFAREVHGGFGVSEPGAVARGSIESEEGAGHGDGVAEEWTGGVFFVVAEAAAG